MGLADNALVLFVLSYSARFSVSSPSAIPNGLFRQFDVARCVRGMVSRVPVVVTAVPLSGVGAVR